MFNPTVLDACRSNTLSVLDCTELGIGPSLLYDHDAPMDSVYALTLLPNGSLASGSLRNRIRIWDPISGRILKVWEERTGRDCLLAALSDGTLAVGSDRLCIWNTDLGAVSKVFKKDYFRMTALTALPDGNLAVAGSSSFLDRNICIFDTDSGEKLKELCGHKKTISALAVLSDGRLASGSEDRTICIWDIDSGEKPKVLTGHEGAVLALAALPDGNLASGSEDKTIHIWDTLSGKRLRELGGHEYPVTALAVLSDGRLASGSKYEIRIWNPSSGMLLSESLVSGSVSALVALPDGRLASASGVIQIWPLVSAALFRTLQAALSDNTSLVRLEEADDFFNAEQKEWLQGVVDRNAARASAGRGGSAFKAVPRGMSSLATPSVASGSAPLVKATNALSSALGGGASSTAAPRGMSSLAGGSAPLVKATNAPSSALGGGASSTAAPSRTPAPSDCCLS